MSELSGREKSACCYSNITYTFVFDCVVYMYVYLLVFFFLLGFTFVLSLFHPLSSALPAELLLILFTFH